MSDGYAYWWLGWSGNIYRPEPSQVTPTTFDLVDKALVTVPMKSSERITLKGTVRIGGKRKLVSGY
jgi:hypothetical protein